MALTVTALSFFAALYSLTASATASCARLTAVSLSNPSAVPDRRTQPACAGAPRAKQKPAAINASAEPRQNDLIGTPPSPVPRFRKSNIRYACLAVPLLTQKDDRPAL